MQDGGWSQRQPAPEGGDSDSRTDRHGDGGGAGRVKPEPVVVPVAVPVPEARSRVRPPEPKVGSSPAPAPAASLSAGEVKATVKVGVQTGEQPVDMSRGFIQRSPVCGSPVPMMLRLSITSTTGSRFELRVPPGETVDGLRRCLSQRLRVPRDRIVLLHKERQLSAGKLQDQGVTDESKITLVPAIEAGSATSKTERNMMQALESLTEAQVSDFLSGRAPLTLALGIGAHMMYVQLQLAAQNVVVGDEQQQQQPQKHPRTWSRTGSINTSQPGPGPAAPTGSINTSQPGPALPRPTPTSAPASPPCQTLPSTPDPLPPTQLGSQGLRTVSPSTAQSSNRIPVICHHHGSPPPPPPPPTSSHTSDPVLPALLSTLTGCPHLPSSSPPLPPVAPLCSPRPASASSSSSGPRSPAMASTVPEDNSHPSSPGKDPGGAVIESLVNHSPGVFSGTFSGTLPPVSQNVINHPRRGIAIILQILNDLLSATRHHQGAPNTLSQLPCPAASNLPTSLPLTPGDPSSGAGRVALTAEATDHLHLSKATGEEEGGARRRSSAEENRALRGKLERLHLLMQQRRLRRRTRRAPPPHPHHPHSSKTSHPAYHHQQQQPRHHHHHHHLYAHSSWSPRRQQQQQRVTRCCQGDGGSLPTGGERTTSPPPPPPDGGGDGDGDGDLQVEMMEVAVEESPWKPELTSDLVVV